MKEEIDSLCEILKTQFFVDTDDDCEEQIIARNRNISLIIAKEFNYSLETITRLLSYEKYGVYQSEYEVYDIKKLLVQSLIFIDINGDHLLSIAFDENENIEIRNSAIWNMQFVSSKENILKLKDIFNINDENDMAFTIVKVFGKLPIFEIIDFLKLQQKLCKDSDWSLAIEEIPYSLKEIELCYGMV